MAEPLDSVAPDPSWLEPRPDADLAAFIIRSRRRDPCAERIRLALIQRLSVADLAKWNEIQGDALMSIFEAIFKGLGLTTEQRDTGKAVAWAALQRVSQEGIW